jgi:hypothetical protein
MAPKDNDQTNERESRIQGMMKDYRREHPPQSPDDPGPHNRDSIPSGVGRGPNN